MPRPESAGGRPGKGVASYVAPGDTGSSETFKTSSILNTFLYSWPKDKPSAEVTIDTTAATTQYHSGHTARAEGERQPPSRAGLLNPLSPIQTPGLNKQLSLLFAVVFTVHGNREGVAGFLKRTSHGRS